jgi:GNAT superfamily N-acetyltransferase
MDIRHKSVNDLTDLEYEACKLWNFNSEPDKDGMMQDDLWLSRREGYGHVIMLWKSEKSRVVNSMLGWALLMPVRPYADWSWGTTYTARKSKYTVEFYVRPEYRNKGYGTLLMKMVKEQYDPRPHVLPHDEGSGAFFSKFDVTVTRDDQKHLIRKPKVA